MTSVSSGPSQRLLTNAIVVTLGESCRVLHDGAVLIQEGRVQAVGSTSDLVKAHPEAPREHLGGQVLMPGQINAHDHLYSAFARGIALKDPSPQNFLQILERLWWRLDAALTQEDVYYSGLMGFIEAARRGTTSIIDHHASPSAIEGSLDQLASAAGRVGLRGCFCYEVTDRHGADGAHRGIEENLRFLRRCRSESGTRLAGAFGLHASITVGPDTLRQCLERSDSSDVFHVHVAEDGCDVEHSQQHYQRGPLERLLGEGLTARPVLAAHCIHLNERELGLLQEHNVTVQHNPRSNMNNAVGCAGVPDLLRRGITVCCGTDGMSQDPSEDLRTMALIHKHQARHCQAFSYGDLYRICYLNNARLASQFFGLPVGEIVPGAAADLMVVEYNPPTPLDESNLVGHLLFGMGVAPVAATMVDGEWVYRQGKVLGVEEKEVLARCRELATQLWHRW